MFVSKRNKILDEKIKLEKERKKIIGTPIIIVIRREN